jgi:hypothetical protein
MPNAHLCLERAAVVACVLALLTGGTAAAQSPARAVLRAVAVTEPPTIDGVLDDVAWSGDAQPTGEWLSYNPLHGDRIPQQTRVWIAHDSRHVYFAFQCDDPDPSAIKTSVTRRDNIWADDWVGLSLDALGSGQTSYHLMVNPSGIQLDLLNTISGNEDPSPDYVWDSAGRTNDRGYSVEIRVPLQTLRFRGGKNVSMGVLFWRRVSRSGVSVSWPPLQPGKWVFENHASLNFDSLPAIKTRELIPSATFASSQERERPERWSSIDGNSDFGFSSKIGLTSTVTLEATVNPDFSQVESDAFQVEVNQRFPVFFSEKRPFFMEGAGLFMLAGSRMDSSMISAVHTRHIVDPSAGFKVTGSVGRVQFGTLTAVDDAAPEAYQEDPALADRDRVFNIARAQYSLGASNYVGATATDAEFAGSFNRVAGGDLSWRIRDTQRVTAMALYSTTRDVGAGSSRGGFAGSASWAYETKRQNVIGFIEHYDRAFRMDTAFYNRVGITSGWAYTDWNFYPEKRLKWIKRIVPFVYSQYGRDRNAGGRESITVSGGRFSFTRQGFFRADYIVGYEPWNGVRYKVRRPRFFGSLQPFRWIGVSGYVDWGPAIYYDAAEPFAGWSRNTRAEISWQPTSRMNQAVEYRRVDFERLDTRAPVYELELVNTKTTFQFTKQFFVRAIAQYDSLRERVLSDFLASYELRPGTVVYVGYGSLYERRAFVEEAWVEHAGDYLTTRRGFFFKASYLYRF